MSWRTSAAAARRTSSTPGAAQSLQQVWIALRASERQILEGVSLAHVARDEMPELVVGLVGRPGRLELSPAEVARGGSDPQRLRPIRLVSGLRL